MDNSEAINKMQNKMMATKPYQPASNPFHVRNRRMHELHMKAGALEVMFVDRSRAVSRSDSKKLL